MTASDLAAPAARRFQRARRAGEYQLVERLARDIALPVPHGARCAARGPGARGAQPALARRAARRRRAPAASCCVLPRLQRRRAAAAAAGAGGRVGLDGALCAPAAGLPACRHARRTRRRDVFAFGTHLTDLTPAFRLADTDAMLAAASAAIDDFAGGTRLGESLATLRQRHARRLVGRRTLVLVISDGLDTGEPEELERELRLADAPLPPAAVAQPAAALRRLCAAGARRRGAAPACARHAGGAQPEQAARTWPRSLAALLNRTRTKEGKHHGNARQPPRWRSRSNRPGTR